MRLIFDWVVAKPTHFRSDALFALPFNLDLSGPLATSHIHHIQYCATGTRASRTSATDC